MIEYVCGGGLGGGRIYLPTVRIMPRFRRKGEGMLVKWSQACRSDKAQYAETRTSRPGISKTQIAYLPKISA